MIQLSTSEAVALLVILVAISAGIAAMIEWTKEVARELRLPLRRERIVYRGLALALGVAAVYALAPWYGAPWPVAVAVGLLAGAASEVVYRWLIRDLLPAAAGWVRRWLGGA